MTNLNIIANEAISTGIFTKDQVTEMITKYGTLLIKTFSEWKRFGYIVKKGQKAKMTCSIWRKKTSKANQNNEVNENEDVKEDNGFYKKVSYFFTIDQVEKIKG